MVKRKIETLESPTTKITKSGEQSNQNEESKEKLIPLGFDESDCDTIIMTKDKTVHIPSSFLNMMSSDSKAFVTGKKMIDVMSENLIHALSFYDPKNWKESDDIKHSTLDELLHISNILNLKSLKKYVIDQFVDNLWVDEIDSDFIDSLNIAQRHEMYTLVNKLLSNGYGAKLESFDLIETVGFKRLHKEIRYEILKGAIYRENDGNKEASYYDAELMELKFIFNFFDMMVYENRAVNIIAKKCLWTLPFHEVTLEDSVDIKLISCEKDLKDCVTIIVENQEINVKSFLLTNNSPVFKAMLNSSSFKEGQNRRIELPGKKYLEVVFFLQCLHSPQDLRDICDYPDVFILSQLCREYQVDWLLEKIRDFINKGRFLTKRWILKGILLCEAMNFDPCEVLVNSIEDNFLDIHMSKDFMELSSKMQVLIARKRMWLLLRNSDEKKRKMLFNEEDCGFLSIFDDQSVFDFKFNGSEKEYIKQFKK
ncbi:uncharacterized protein [Clytia hemisphaerica]|uniref:BTB domain-containing protein n=1 Tax=Clytia hemisphaerica TaxID=252671 RepID=A0A7M5XAY9_9CNID